MNMLRKCLVSSLIMLLLAVVIYQARLVASLRRENQRLVLASAGEIEALQRDLSAMSNQVTTLMANRAKVFKDDPELLKLRAEITLLHSDQNSGGNASLQKLVGQASLLKQKLEQMPERKIPELAFVTDKDWINAVYGEDLSKDDGVREALSKLREAAENRFLNEMMQGAIKKYLADHDGILPPDLSQLKAYFNVPVTDEMLERYQLLQTGKPVDNEDLVKLAVFADPDYDTTHGMRLNGAWGGSYNKVQQSVQSAASAYARDNFFQLPTDPAQLSGYLDRDIDPDTVQKYLGQMAENPPSSDLMTISTALKAYNEANNGLMPNNTIDLLPYATTPEQKAVVQKLQMQQSASVK